MKCTQIDWLQAFANSDSGAVSNPHVCPTLYWMTGRRWECNMRMQCLWDKRRIPFRSIETASNTDSDSSCVATETLARPLGTAHFATVKCQLIHQFATIQVTKFAIRFVRWTQLFSSIWPDLVDIRGLPSQKVAPIKSQCRSTDFAQWNARVGID